MLLDCQLPWSFWGFAAEAFVYTKNRSPHSKLFRSTPYEQWFGRALDLTNLHVFGFICYVHIPKEIRKRQGPGNKLLPKATKMIFVGYATNKKAWKCFDPATKTTIETIHVRFDDDSVPANGPSTAITSFHEAIEPSQLNSDSGKSIVNQNRDSSNNRGNYPSAHSDTDNNQEPEIENSAPTMEQHSTDEENSVPQEKETEATSNVLNQHNITRLPKVASNEQPETSRSRDGDLTQENRNSSEEGYLDPRRLLEESMWVNKPNVHHHPTAGKWTTTDKPTKWDPSTLPEAGSKRTRKQAIKYPTSVDDSTEIVSDDDPSERALMIYTFLVSSDTPTFTEAMNGPDREAWLQAINEEYSSLFKNDTFSEPISLPPGERAIDTKIVLRLKEAEHPDAPRRRKARLCGKGYQQVHEHTTLIPMLL